MMKKILDHRYSQTLQIMGLATIMLGIVGGVICFCLYGLHNEIESSILPPGEYTTGSWWFDVMDDGSLDNIQSWDPGAYPGAR